jgi:protein gp37
MQPAWVDSILLQCRHAGVPFFFKQWGGAQKKRPLNLSGFVAA